MTLLKTLETTFSQVILLTFLCHIFKPASKIIFKYLTSVLVWNCRCTSHTYWVHSTCTEFTWNVYGHRRPLCWPAHWVTLYAWADAWFPKWASDKWVSGVANARWSQQTLPADALGRRSCSWHLQNLVVLGASNIICRTKCKSGSVGFLVSSVQSFNTLELARWLGRCRHWWCCQMMTWVSFLEPCKGGRWELTLQRCQPISTRMP